MIIDALLFSFGCSEYHVREADPVPVADPPGRDLDDQGQPPASPTCSTGLSGRSAHLRAPHPAVAPKAELPALLQALRRTGAPHAVQDQLERGPIAGVILDNPVKFPLGLPDTRYALGRASGPLHRTKKDVQPLAAGQVLERVVQVRAADDLRDLPR